MGVSSPNSLKKEKMEKSGIFFKNGNFFPKNEKNFVRLKSFPLEVEN